MLIFLQNVNLDMLIRVILIKIIYAGELCFIRRSIQTFLSKLTRIFQNTWTLEKVVKKCLII